MWRICVHSSQLARRWMMRGKGGYEGWGRITIRYTSSEGWRHYAHLHTWLLRVIITFICSMTLMFVLFVPTSNCSLLAVEYLRLLQLRYVTVCRWLQHVIDGVNWAISRHFAGYSACDMKWSCFKSNQRRLIWRRVLATNLSISHKDEKLNWPKWMWMNNLLKVNLVAPPGFEPCELLIQKPTRQQCGHRTLQS